MRFQNFDEARRSLVQNCRTMAYCQLFQKVPTPGNPKAESAQIIARWDVPPAQVIAERAPGDEDDDQGNGTALLDPSTANGAATNGAGHDAKEPPWLETCMVWLRHRADMFVRQAGTSTKFQLKCFGAGGRYITSCHFIGIPSPEEDTSKGLKDAMDSLLQMESEISGGAEDRIVLDPATFPDVHEVEGAVGLQLLELTGTMGAFVHKLVLPTTRVMMGQMLGVNRHLGGLCEQQRRVIASQDERIRELTSEIRAYEISTSNDNRERQQRQQLVGKTVTELGGIGRAWIASKAGIPPAMLPLMELVMADPELQKTLSDPGVQDFLRDPAERAELISLLNGVSARYAEKKKEREAAAKDGPRPDAPKPPADGIDAPGLD